MQGRGCGCGLGAAAARSRASPAAREPCCQTRAAWRPQTRCAGPSCGTCAPAAGERSRNTRRSAAGRPGSQTAHVPALLLPGRCSQTLPPPSLWRLRGRFSGRAETAGPSARPPASSAARRRGRRSAPPGRAPCAGTARTCTFARPGGGPPPPGPARARGCGQSSRRAPVAAASTQPRRLTTAAAGADRAATLGACPWLGACRAFAVGPQSPRGAPRGAGRAARCRRARSAWATPPWPAPTGSPAYT